MPQNNSLGIVSGLALVAVLLATIASFGFVSSLVREPFPSTTYELAGSSRPVP
jgi:hypothetical protein